MGSPLKVEKEKLLKSLYASSRISQKSLASNKTNVRYSVFCGNFRNNQFKTGLVERRFVQENLMRPKSPEIKGGFIGTNQRKIDIRRFA